MVATNGAFSQMKILTWALRPPYKLLSPVLLIKNKYQSVSAPSQGVSTMQPSQSPSPSPSPSMAHQQQLTSLLSPLLGMSSLRVQQPSSLAAHIPQKTKQSITGGEFDISISLGCLSLSNFESKQVNAPTPPCKKKNHIDSIDRWLSALQFTAQSFWPLFPHRAGVMFAYQEIIWLARHKLTGFAWLCYYIDFSLFVGVGTIFLMVAPFLPLGPHLLQNELYG